MHGGGVLAVTVGAEINSEHERMPRPPTAPCNRISIWLSRTWP
jgi:hypothetical protein